MSSFRFPPGGSGGGLPPADYSWQTTDLDCYFDFTDYDPENFSYTSVLNGFLFEPVSNMPNGNRSGPGNSLGLRSSLGITTSVFSHTKLTHTLSSSVLDLTAGQSFSIIYQFKSPTDQKGTTSNIYLYDFTSFAGSNQGFLVEHSETRWRLYVTDDVGTTHSSLFNAGGALWKDGKFYTVVWRFNRSSTKASLSYKEEGQDWVNVDPVDIIIAGSNFNTLGAITFSTSLTPRIAISGWTRSGDRAGGFTRTLYKFGFTKNLTYTPNQIP